MNEYELLDSGHGRKLERFGKVTLDRPCAQAVWNPSQPVLWKQADAFFTRKQGLEWRGRDKLPDSWIAEVKGVKMKLSNVLITPSNGRIMIAAVCSLFPFPCSGSTP